MKNKVIVIGAAGHIGAYTFDYLTTFLDLNDWEVIASGRREVNYFKNNGFEYIQLDICNKDDFKKLPKDNVYAVICLAGIMPATMEGYNPYLYIDVNVTGMLNVLEYCRNVGVKKIITTTTEADLSGYWDTENIIKADLPPKFDYGNNYSMYVISKRMVLDMLEHYKEMYGLVYYTIRCSTVYMYTENPYMYKNGKLIIPGYRQIYEKAINGETIELWGNPKAKSEIVYVKDFAQIVLKCITTKDSNGGVFNLGNGMPVSFEDQIRMIVEVFGSIHQVKSEIVYKPDMPTSRNFVQDITKTREVLGYVPKYDFGAYLEDYKNEMIANRYRNLFK